MCTLLKILKVLRYKDKISAHSIPPYLAPVRPPGVRYAVCAPGRAVTRACIAAFSWLWVQQLAYAA